MHAANHPATRHYCQSVWRADPREVVGKHPRPGPRQLRRRERGGGVSGVPKLMARPVPSLGQWLGDGARAEGFEEWVRENLDHEAHIVDPNERAVLRMVISCRSPASKSAGARPIFTAATILRR